MDVKLAEKIYNVMCAIEGVEKSVTVGKDTKGEYKAVGEADVLNIIKPLLKQEKLICLPVDGTIEDYVNIVENYNKKSTRSITQLKVYFNLVDVESGESVQIVGFGNGADSQDKGSGKAFTYAYKTALQKTFCMFSGEDSDNTHSNDYGKEDNTITTAELESVLGENVQATIAHYNKKTGKNISELKYMSQDYKQVYYKKAKEKQ